MLLRRAFLRVNPRARFIRRYTTTTPPEHPNPTPKQKSAHAQWYADIVPAMIPIALLGSAVYLALQLTQSSLLHEKYLDEARTKVTQLEAQIEKMQSERD